MLDKAWHRWVAENVLLGVDAGILVRTMVAKGISASDADCAVKAAQSHPYIEAARSLLKTHAEQISDRWWSHKAESHTDTKDGNYS